MQRFMLATLAVLACAVLVSAAAGDTGECANNLNEPVVPTYTQALDGSTYQLTVTFPRRVADANGENGGGYAAQFEVKFGGATSNPCYFISPNGTEATYTGVANSGVTWTKGTATNPTTGCLQQWTMSGPISTVLGQCGYTQQTRNDRVHFITTVGLHGEQWRGDLQREMVLATRNFAFTSDVNINNRVSASSDVSVFGAAVDYNLLSDLAVTVEGTGTAADAYRYYVSGTLSTNVQWPYVLTLASNTQDDDFVNPTFDDSAQTCASEAVDYASGSCTQGWTFRLQIDPNQACVTDGISALTDQTASWTYNIGCSAGFEGECANSFSRQPSATVTLRSSDFCPKVAEISLTGALNIYKFQLGDDDSAVGAVNQWGSTTATSQISQSYWQVEETFVYESTLFGEAVVTVDNGAATLASTTITKISTIPVGRTTIVVYEDADGDTVADTSVGSVEVYNTGFNSDADSAYANSRARFEFELNAQTFDRNNDASIDADPAQPGKIEVDLLVTYAEAAASFDPALQTRTVRASMPSLLSNDRSTTDTFSAAFTSTPSVAGGASNAAPAASGSSTMSAMTVGALAVAGVAIIALVAVVVVVRRKRSPAKDLNRTSSSVELN